MNLLERAQKEAERARGIFPDPKNLLLALVEEHGEVVKAALDIQQKDGAYDDLDKEIVQCMAMCIRLHEEGDPAIGVEPMKESERIDFDIGFQPPAGEKVVSMVEWNETIYVATERHVFRMSEDDKLEMVEFVNSVENE